VGKSSALKHLRKPPLEAIASEGAGYFIKMGYGWKEDLERIEDDGGCIKGADASCIPTTAQNRSDQLGTIGGGNHFIEIGRVSRVFDKEIASKFGLYPKHLYVLIHTGSRGFGHQICTEYSRIMWEHAEKNNATAPVKGLACAPIFSEDGVILKGEGEEA
jgi:tRNA-splicing ligase RtcB